MLKGVSLFSSAGIGEAYLKEVGIDIIVANEFLKDRANLYKELYPKANVIFGDILDDKVYGEILNKSGKKVDFLIATPPCQGMSVAGKNRDLSKMVDDKRNYLIFRVVDFIKEKYPDFVLIENVPLLLKIELPFNGKRCKVPEILNMLFQDKYIVESGIFDSSDYGVPQKRKRAIIRLYKKNYSWDLPKKEQPITVKESIGKLPSLEAGQSSNIKWHFARKHNTRQILCMQHTPTGKSAFENRKYYPVKNDGEKIDGWKSTYRRMKWDEPAPAITIRNDAISSHMNVHPGRHLNNGKYSDARVLTPLELIILTSLPKDWALPDDTPELLLRKCLGESIPPLMTKKIVSGIRK